MATHAGKREHSVWQVYSVQSGRTLFQDVIRYTFALCSAEPCFGLLSAWCPRKRCLTSHTPRPRAARLPGLVFATWLFQCFDVLTRKALLHTPTQFLVRGHSRFICAGSAVSMPDAELNVQAGARALMQGQLACAVVPASSAVPPAAMRAICAGVNPLLFSALGACWLQGLWRVVQPAMAVAVGLQRQVHLRLQQPDRNSRVCRGRQGHRWRLG